MKRTTGVDHSARIGEIGKLEIARHEKDDAALRGDLRRVCAVVGFRVAEDHGKNHFGI